METIKMHTHVGKDGILRLEVPVGLINSDLEVVVTVQPIAPTTEDRAEWLAFIERTAGSLADDPIDRPPQGDYELREPLHGRHRSLQHGSLGRPRP